MPVLCMVSVSSTPGATALARMPIDRVPPRGDALGAAVGQLRATTGCPVGTIRVRAFRIAAELFRAPMLARFAHDYPEFVLDLTLDDTVVDVIAEGIAAR